MHTIVLPESDLTPAVLAAAECLRRGGVIAAPTETVYGLMTAWENQPGRDRIYELKARNETKPLQMLAAGTSNEDTAGELVPDARLKKLADALCPGPLTIVVNGLRGSVGLRIPDSVFVLSLVRELGQPLAATSANVSGQPPAVIAGDAVRGLVGQPDLLLDGGPVRHAAASTVVSLLGPEVELLREGPIPFDQIRSLLDNPSCPGGSDGS